MPPSSDQTEPGSKGDKAARTCQSAQLLLPPWLQRQWQSCHHDNPAQPWTSSPAQPGGRSGQQSGVEWIGRKNVRTRAQTQSPAHSAPLGMMDEAISNPSSCQGLWQEGSQSRKRKGCPRPYSLSQGGGLKTCLGTMRRPMQLQVHELPEDNCQSGWRRPLLGWPLTA